MLIYSVLLQRFVLIFVSVEVEVRDFRYWPNGIQRPRVKMNKMHCGHFSLKFIYSEKPTKFCEFFTEDLFVTAKDQYKVEISQNFVVFSECMNFNLMIFFTYSLWRQQILQQPLQIFRMPWTCFLTCLPSIKWQLHP